MLRALGALADEGVEYVLIGAAAMGVHGIVRATEDLDLFVRGTAENVERLQRALRKVYGNDPNIDQISAQDLLGEYPAVRYYPPTGDLYFDVMTRLGTAASYETVEAEEKEIAGVRVKVASPRALYLLKRDTVRAIDQQDATALARAFKLDETP
jgi:acylphosphatase